MSCSLLPSISCCAAAASSIRRKVSTASLDVAVRDGRIVAVAKNLPGPARRVDRRARQARAAGDDRHACHARLSLCQRPLRARGRHGRRPFGRDHPGRSGWPVGALPSPASASSSSKPGREPVLAAASSAYMVAMRRAPEGHYYPELYRPDCIAVDDTVRAARENADLVRGVKGHAGDRRLHALGGDKGDEARVPEIGRALDLPLYIHFGQLWPLPNDKHPYDADAVRRPDDAEDPAAGRYPGASLHAPSRRLRRPARQAAPGGARRRWRRS